MNLGDTPEHERENNSEEIIHKPEESDSQEETKDYEYVDEDGNPIDPEEMGDYEIIEEDEDEPEDSDEELEDEPEDSDEEESLTQEETEEILGDIKEISGIQIDQLKVQNSYTRQLIQETIEEPVVKEQIIQPELIQEETYIHESLPQNSTQPETYYPEPIKEETNKFTQEDLDFKRKQEELIRTISTGHKPEESDLDIFIKNAQESQQRISEIKNEPAQQITETNPQEPVKTMYISPETYNLPQESLIQEPFVEEQIIQPEHIPQNSTQPEETNKESTNEDLLRKLSMSNQSHSEILPEETNKEDSIENPYIYRKGHPHLGANFSMDTISNLANKIFNTDEAVDKLNKKRKFNSSK